MRITTLDAWFQFEIPVKYLIVMNHLIYCLLELLIALRDEDYTLHCHNNYFSMFRII